MSLSSPTSAAEKSPSDSSPAEGPATGAPLRSEGGVTHRLSPRCTTAPTHRLPVLSACPMGEKVSHGGVARRPATRWDFWGALASGLCVVHCIALPLVLPALAMAGWNQAGWDCCQEGSAVHVVLFCLVVPIGLVALISGYRRHRRLGTLALGGVGVVLLAVALLLGGQSFGLVNERVLTVLGSLTLITAHLLNQRRCRCC